MLLAGLSITISSCKKERNNPLSEEPDAIPAAFNTNNVNALINNLTTPLQTYTINAAGYNTHLCVNGTTIFIYPNAFLTQSGQPVTGVVTIEAKDVLSKKDMIMNNAMPVSNGRLLVSGGEVYFNATQGGQKLKMNPASAVYFQVPTGNTPSYQMKEFYANASVNISETGLNWVTDTTSINTNTIAVVQDTSGVNGQAYHYTFQCDSVTWTNCDYFYNTPGARTTCTINLTGAFNNSNTAVFISMNGVNALARLNASYYALSQAFISYTNSLPETIGYTVVAISFDGTNYFYGSKTISMTTDMVVGMPALTQTTKSQIEFNLTTLP